MQQIAAIVMLPRMHINLAATRLRARHGSVGSGKQYVAVHTRIALCYEETDHDVCHLQKAAPKHWFSEGETISVDNCPTRFGTLGWSARALPHRQWCIHLNLPKKFAADIVIHIHPDDDRPLRTTTQGVLHGSRVVLRKGSLVGARQLSIQVS
jgi:hypothetical protein